ncbi:MAG: hypothetical protein LBQ38_05650 [Spirochaetaceae bacterium]|jgi:hypothetical protein|nr:hypothetical protein [Spirochaetaceae bacterium]
MSEAEITLYIYEGGDDSNEGTFEKPLWSVAAALDRVRWKSYETACFVISGSITEPAARQAMIDITGRGLPAIVLQSRGPKHPGILNAKGLNKRVIYIADGNTLFIKDYVIIRGGAKNLGGSGIALEGGTLVMTGGEISGNDSGFAMGGGVYVGKDSEFIMEGGVIKGNNTTMSGGGVFPDEGGKFTMRSGVISGNTAFISGGGVFVGLDSEFILSGGVIEKNKAGGEKTMLIGGVPMPCGQGGGVFVSERARFTMTEGKILENRAIAVQEEDAGSGSGGGVFVEKGGIFSCEKGTITKNGVMSWGGGVYAGGDFSCGDGCLIGSNAARLGGGGVHVCGDGVFTMKGGVLLNNVTGGIGGAVNIAEQGSFMMENGLVSKNSAAEMGNAFAINSAVTVAGGVIVDNNYLPGEKEKNTASKPMPLEKAGFAVVINEAGKLTLKGGELDGKIGMKNQNQLEDTRQTAAEHTEESRE